MPPYEGIDVDGAMGSFETTRLKDIINTWILSGELGMSTCVWPQG